MNDNAIKVQSNHRVINVTLDSPYFQQVGGQLNSLICFFFSLSMMNECMNEFFRCNMKINDENVSLEFSCVSLFSKFK